MAALDDLTAAVAALKTEVLAAVADMDALLKALNDAIAANNPTAIAQATADINAAVQNLKDAVSRDTPPATP